MEKTKTSPPSKLGFNRGSWTAAEDKILLEYVAAHGVGKWGKVNKTSGLNRCPRSCRHRWLNYLRPDIKRGNISDDEEELILRLHNLLGNRWSLIAGRLPGRTDNEIKNYWNTVLKKKIKVKSNSSSGLPTGTGTGTGTGTNTTNNKCKTSTCSSDEWTPFSEDNILLLDDSFSLSIEDRDVFEQLASLETEGFWPRGVFDFEFFQGDAGIWGGADYGGDLFM